MMGRFFLEVFVGTGCRHLARNYKKRVIDFTFSRSFASVYMILADETQFLFQRWGRG